MVNNPKKYSRTTRGFLPPGFELLQTSHMSIKNISPENRSIERVWEERACNLSLTRSLCASLITWLEQRLGLIEKEVQGRNGNQGQSCHCHLSNVCAHFLNLVSLDTLPTDH